MLANVKLSLQLYLVNPCRRSGRAPSATLCVGGSGGNETDGNSQSHLHATPQGLRPLPSLSGPSFFLSRSCWMRMGACSSQERATESCATHRSAHPFYLVPASLAASQELGREQHGSQARGLLAAGTEVRGLDLALGSQGTA